MKPLRLWLAGSWAGPTPETLAVAVCAVRIAGVAGMASTRPMEEGEEDTELPRGQMGVYGAAVADGSLFH